MNQKYELSYNLVIILRKVIFFILIFSGFFAMPVLSAPLKNIPITLTQPNGKIINCFASGDEFYNWVHDKDDFTIIQDLNSGYYVYAIKSGDELVSSGFIVGDADPKSAGLLPGVNISAKKILSIRNKFLNSDILRNSEQVSAPTLGAFNNLVIFIRFKDDPDFNEEIFKYDSSFNNVSNNSMSNYFNEVSYNKIQINTSFYPKTTSTVLSYQDDYTRSYYMPYNSQTNTNGYLDTGVTLRTLREHNLLARAVDYVSSQIPSSLNIDINNDGRVDNICFIIQGSTTAWSTLLWPHRWSLYSKNILINGKRVYDYNFQLQKAFGVNVLCHEMFHTLGAPDLYHYTNQGLVQPAGVWDIMDNGSSHMLAYMKWKYGKWIDSIPEIKSFGSYTLNSLISSPNCAYKIRSSKSAQEYFIVEYRRKSGLYESKLPGNGLLVYRINPVYNGNASGPPDEVYVYRPNGTPNINGKQADAFFSKDVNRFILNDTTNPISFLSNGQPGGLNISVGLPVDVNKSTSTISFTLSPSVNPQMDYLADSKIFSWNDIKKTGKKITNWKNGTLDSVSARDDGWIPKPIPIGFSFYYFNQKFDSIYIDVNGVVSFTQKVLNTSAKDFGDSEINPGYFDSSFTFPGNPYFGNSIAVSYADFDLNKSDGFGNGDVYYGTINNQLIISWENVGTFEKAGDTLNSFQLILDKKDNSILIQIKKIGMAQTRKKIKIGIQKNQVRGLGWIDYGIPIERIPADNSTVLFYPIVSQSSSVSENYSTSEFELKQNYPNPFNPITEISYTVGVNNPLSVQLRVYDILGCEVANLVNEKKQPGSYKVNFNGSNLASGIYYYRLVVSGSNPLQTERFSEVKKMMLIK